MKELNPLQIGILIDKTNASKSFCSYSIPYSKDSVMLSGNNYGQQDYLGLSYFESLVNNVPVIKEEDNRLKSNFRFPVWKPFRRY